MFRTAISVAAALTCGLFVLAGPAAATITQQYAFDSDPGWLAGGNRPADGAGQDFGFSNTNYSGGTAGEIGGVFDRYQHGVAAYYACNVGSLDLSQPIEMNWNSASGANFFYGNQGNGTDDQGVMLGFFNRTTGQRSPWPVRPMLGVEVADYSLYSYAAFSGGANETLLGALSASGNYVGTLRMLYDPSAGSYGQFSVQLGTATPVTYSLSQADRTSGATFDSFGLVTIPSSTNRPSASLDFYVDSLAITSSVPEPSAIILVVSALAGMLVYGWRKRK